MMIKNVLPKRRILLFALLCLLLGTTLVGCSAASTSVAPAQVVDKDEKCTNAPGAIDPNYVVAGLAPGKTKKNWRDEPVYNVIMIAGGSRAEGDDLEDVQEHTPADQKMRLFLTSNTTCVLLYYDVQGNLKGKKYTLDPNNKNKLKMDIYEVPENRFMNDRNTPLWDIVGSKDGFYSPKGCYIVNSNPKDKEPTCKRDCFTIDQYCLWDYGINAVQTARMDPKLGMKGGPRSYYNGLKYNSIYCNSFSAIKDGQDFKLVVKNANEKEKVHCFKMPDMTMRNVQFWSNKWRDSPNCTSLDGVDLGPPTPQYTTTSSVTLPSATLPSTTLPSTTLPSAASGDAQSSKACIYKEDITKFMVCALLLSVLMTVAAIAVLVAFCVSPKVDAMPKVHDE